MSSTTAGHLGIYINDGDLPSMTISLKYKENVVVRIMKYLTTVSLFREYGRTERRTIKARGWKR